MPLDRGLLGASMNPCIRCQHIIIWRTSGKPQADLMNSQCGHPGLQTMNVVTGEPQAPFCTTARLIGNKCGPEGELWAYDDAFPPAQEWEE